MARHQSAPVSGHRVDLRFTVTNVVQQITLKTTFVPIDFNSFWFSLTFKCVQFLLQKEIAP